MRDHLVARLRRVEPGRIDAMLRDELIVGRDGPIDIAAPFAPGQYLWFHRDLPVELPVPFPLTVLHRDDDIVVVDKPHFLATIPRGRHVVETALVRLRRELDLPDLSPAHRLDRVTAGVLLFVVRRELRGAYQTLFRDRRVRKTYEAVAPFDTALQLPRTVRSRIVKERGVIPAREVPGPPNAETLVEVVEEAGGLARYRLTPSTGRTHQLRLHLRALGVPILGDRFYGTASGEPEDAPLDDYTRPLQLLAATLEFRDPISGVARRFASRRALQAWTDPAGWAAGTPVEGAVST
jgi:tRNA pseudouridine32 synthase / 23S rRNA pseudouridine746 synthase